MVEDCSRRIKIIKTVKKTQETGHLVEIKN